MRRTQVVIFGGGVILLLIMQLYSHYSSFQLMASQMRERHFLQQQALIQREVQRIVEQIRYSQLQVAEIAAQQGMTIADAVAQMQQELLQEIESIRFGDNGYLFVDDWDGVVLAHGAQPQLKGQNIFDYTDPNGVKVVQQLIAAAQRPDGDFVRYSWRKPDTQIDRPKISFAMGIPEWRWMVGTGVYTDDVEQTIDELYAALKQQMRATLSLVLMGALLVGVLLQRRLSRLQHTMIDDLHSCAAAAATRSSATAATGATHLAGR